MWHPAKPLLENRVVFVHCIVIIMHCLSELFRKPSFALHKYPSLFQRQNPERIGYFISLKTICKAALFSNKQDQTNTYLKTYTQIPIPTQTKPTHHSQLATSPLHQFPTHLPPQQSTTSLSLFHPVPSYPSLLQAGP